MNYFYLVLTQCLITITIGNEFFISSPHLLHSYECLEKTKITIILPNSNNQGYYNSMFKLIKTLEDPCHDIFYFVRQSQKVVQWEGNRNKFDIHHKKSGPVDGPEYIDFLKNLHQNRKLMMKIDNSTTQILVLDIQLSDQILEIVEQLRKDKSFLKIVIMCGNDECPIIPSIPIQQMVPKDYIENTGQQIRTLVQNPHFNRFEFLKYVKLDGGNPRRLKCLDKKTIHIFHGYLSVKLLENIALLAYNIQELNSTSKIVLYFPNWRVKGKRFWNYYMTEIGSLNNMTNIEIKFVKEPPFKPAPTEGTDSDIYLINDVTISLMFMSMKHFCSRPSVVFYGSLADDSEWYNNWSKNYFDKRCKNNFKKATFKDYSSKNDLEVDFIDELLNVTRCS